MTTDELDALVDGIAPVIDTLIQRALDAPLARMTALEARPPARDGRDGLGGVPGVPGEKGCDGVDGRPGVDGLGFDDLSVDYDGERTIALNFARGDQLKRFPIKLVGLPIYRQVWQDGKTYEQGDSVTWAGSEWHCHTTTTTKPGDGSKAWTLKVKRGRDGKDGKDGAMGPRGEPGRDWQQVYDETRRR